MSLDTVLKIGKAFRNSSIGLSQHRYINSMWKDIEAFKKNKDEKGLSVETVVYSLSVLDTGDEYVFDFQNITQINDQDQIKTLMYLNFKTSDNDSEKKYLFGDIIYSFYINKKGEEKENGNYRMEKLNRGKIKQSSFGRAKIEADSLQDTIIGKFRKTFEKNLKEIEVILKKHNSVVLHFEFANGKGWVEQPNVLNLINRLLIQEFVIEHKESNKIVLNKFLFKTIGGTTPNFSNENDYKIKSFETKDEVIDLMYGVSISEKPLISFNDFGIVVLPNIPIPDNASYEEWNSMALVLNRFLQKKGLAELSDSEVKLRIENDNQKNDVDVFDSIFGILIDNELPESVKYDLIFIKPSGLSSPSVDMIEISSIEKSKLREIHDNILKIKLSLRELSNFQLGKSKHMPKLDIWKSYYDILGMKGKTQKKYSFHLLKILPQIYTDTYYNDPILFSLFINKIEKNIRDNISNFNIMKYDFYFLIQIQKGDNMTPITESKSYTIGKNLGIMARPFAAWRVDCPIKSFEKNYVGNLSRRISDLNDVTKFSNFLNEKLIMHERNYQDVQNAFSEMITNMKLLSNSIEKYDKHACALGFFESYFHNY